MSNTVAMALFEAAWRLSSKEGVDIRGEWFYDYLRCGLNVFGSPGIAVIDPHIGAGRNEFRPTSGGLPRQIPMKHVFYLWAVQVREAGFMGGLAGKAWPDRIGNWAGKRVVKAL